MSRPPPPTAGLAELSEALGDEDARELARLFLRDYPEMMRLLETGSSQEPRRMAHSLKSSAQHMGATKLAELFAALEHRLEEPGAKATAEDLSAISAEFARVEGPLREYGEG